MIVMPSEKDDFISWLKLAREVEPLFGAMASEVAFQKGLVLAIFDGQAFVAKDSEFLMNAPLAGGIIIEPRKNEIAWLAVAGNRRNQGVGAMLLEYALERLDPAQPVRVVTFADSVAEGLPARNLYLKYGFADQGSKGANPAGFPVVLMARPPQK